MLIQVYFLEMIERQPTILIVGLIMIDVIFYSKIQFSHI